MKIPDLLNKIYPLPPIGGLEISDSALQLVESGKGKSSSQFYRLPRGVVEGGQVKNKAELVGVLKELAKKSPNKGKLGIVLTLPSNHVFIQTVKLPPAASHNLEEAAALNVQMVSPLKQGEFYYDWQRVTSNGPHGGPIELLGAFVAREVVESIATCFREAGLSLVAVEFASLSLVRALAQKKIIQTGKPYLVAQITPEGTTFMLTLGNQLLFHSFHVLGNAEDGKIAVSDFIATLAAEVSTIANFYLAHWGGVVNDLVFVSTSLTEEIQSTFKDKSVVVVGPEEVAPASGAMARQILGEREINLLGTSSLNIYEENRALTFVTLWRTVLVSAFGFLLLVALGTDVFLRQVALREMEVNALTLNEPEHKELVSLREEASRFNELVSLIQGARGVSPELGRVAGLVNDLAGVEIRINRLYIPSLGDPITVSGVALNEQAAVAFKNRLADEKSITQVDLPISSIAPETGGRVSFTIYLEAEASE